MDSLMNTRYRYRNAATTILDKLEDNAKLSDLGEQSLREHLSAVRWIHGRLTEVDNKIPFELEIDEIEEDIILASDIQLDIALRASRLCTKHGFHYSLLLSSDQHIDFEAFVSSYVFECKIDIDYEKDECSVEDSLTEVAMDNDSITAVDIHCKRKVQKLVRKTAVPIHSRKHRIPTDKVKIGPRDPRQEVLTKVNRRKRNRSHFISFTDSSDTVSLEKWYNCMPHSYHKYYTHFLSVSQGG